MGTESDSNKHGKVYDQEGHDDFNPFLSGDWVETKTYNADVLTCLKYGVKEVYVRVHFMRSQKGKSVEIAFLSRSFPWNKELKTIKRDIPNDNLVQFFPVSFTIDDYTKVDEDDICEYIFEVKLGKHKHSPNKILEVHAVIYIPEIMKHLGWNEGAKVQEKWFKGLKNAYPWEGTPNIGGLSIDWVLGYSRVKEVYNKNKDLWKTENAIKQLKKEINKMKADGIIKFPTPTTPSTSFGTFNSATKIIQRTYKDEKNKELTVNETIPIYDDYYYQTFVYEERTWAALDDFYATIANCTFRFVAQGVLTYRSGYPENPNVLITLVGLYMRDGFDFVGNQLLGFWSLKKKDAKRNPFGTSYRLIDNASYRNYRKSAQEGGDFYNYSTLKIIPVSHTFIL